MAYRVLIQNAHESVQNARGKVRHPVEHKLAIYTRQLQHIAEATKYTEMKSRQDGTKARMASYHRRRHSFSSEMIATRVTPRSSPGASNWTCRKRNRQSSKHNQDRKNRHQWASKENAHMRTSNISGEAPNDPDSYQAWQNGVRLSIHSRTKQLQHPEQLHQSRLALRGVCRGPS